MGEVKIRNACLDDSSAIARLISQLGYPTSSDEMKGRLAGILSDSDYETLIAEVRKDAVGVIGVGVSRYYERDGVYGRLLALVVDESWRGQGVGACLVAQAERWLKERGVTSVVVNSGKHRDAAHRFYRQLGYEETGVRLVKSLS
jgi:GNAT superfamily N-acetyltransferase